MTERAAKMRATRAANKAAKERQEKSRADAQRIVATGKCPLCGGGLRNNLAITGWWQCLQYGSTGFRKDDSKPSCDFQCFTA